jgi:large subunit ribosomal protein L5e
MVVRFTNRDIITQIVSAEVSGDKVLASAYSHELKRYGITHGLTNWAAAYATGLLLARRALNKLDLDNEFHGVEDPDGEYTLTEAAETDEGTRRPFKVFLDVGLSRTTTGARVFGAMKGASDGGIFIPHSENRFPGYDIETKELDAETLRKYIFSGHVSEWMETLADEDEERYRSQFQKYIEDEVDAADLEEIYAEAHKAIREDPFKKDDEEESKKSKEEWKAESKKYRTLKKSREEKAAGVEAKIRKLAA